MEIAIKMATGQIISVKTATPLLRGKTLPKAGAARGLGGAENASVARFITKSPIEVPDAPHHLFCLTEWWKTSLLR